jgi:putative phage-type endonuclease
MTLHVFDNLVQGTPEWMAARRGLVTASVVGKLITPTLKVANNDVSRGITATLVAERITGYTEETAMTSDMWRGVDSEPIARDIYSGHYQQAVEVGFMRRDEDGWTLGYSPDGLVGVDGLLEIKAPRQKTHLKTILTDDVPDHYWPQLQAGLLVSGRQWIDFVSYCGGMPLYVKRVEPDPDWFEAIEAACRHFELTADLMHGDYELATRDLPATERINLDEIKVA